MGTNKCLVKQLLCLYPFPQVSQRRSGRLPLRPSLRIGCPSLPLRRRAFSGSKSPSSADMSFNSSSIALSCMSMLESGVTNLWVGRLAGGEGRLPVMTDRGAPLLETVFRRVEMAIGSGMALSPASWIAAATAAVLVAVLVMLLRRVTRLALAGPTRMEWELLRECDCRVAVKEPVVELEDREKRCVSGLDACWSSCAGRARRVSVAASCGLGTTPSWESFDPGGVDLATLEEAIARELQRIALSKLSQYIKTFPGRELGGRERVSSQASGRWKARGCRVVGFLLKINR